MKTKEQIEVEKKRLKAEYGDLFDSVVEILFQHDLMGINFEDNRDEYEPEARTILPRLRTCRSSEDVATVLHEEFQRWFGGDIAGSKETYELTAKEIWERCCK